jgi:thiamine kinase-like enzyme
VDDRLAALRDLIPILNGDVTITPLEGGITNHNYRIDAGGEQLVLRIGGEGTALLGVDREVEYACSLAAMDAGVGVEVLAFVPEHAALLTRFARGAVLSPHDLTDRRVLHRVTEALWRFHSVPVVPGAFSPFDVVRVYHARAIQAGVSLPVEMARARHLLDAIELELATEAPLCPCHNDLLPSNLLDDGAIVRIIDWEYAGMGDRFFDLGNLAVNCELDAAGEEALLTAYFGAVRRDDLRRLRLMRLASDMREALWGYLQAGISSLEFDFLSYANEHLDRFLQNASREDAPFGSLHSGSRA